MCIAVTFIIVGSPKSIDGVIHNDIPVFTSKHLKDSQEGCQETVEVDPRYLLRKNKVAPEQLHAEERENQEEEEKEEEEANN